MVPRVRQQPVSWSYVPVRMLDKKKQSDEIRKKRDISLPSQLKKLQANLYFSAYASVMPRLHDGNYCYDTGRTWT
jgi:hypothetical protein